VAEHLEKYPDAIDAEIAHQAEVLASKELVSTEDCSSNLSDQLMKLAKSIRGISATSEDPDKKLAAEVIGLICEKKINEANDLLSKSATTLETLRQWPMKGLALYVYWKLCQFGKIVYLLQVHFTHCTFDDNVNMNASSELRTVR